jgi:hypothetical protein
MMVLFAMQSALAQDPSVAERKRLEDELVKLAQRNTWSGVDRTYRSLVELDTPLSVEDHRLGAQAAQTQGDALLAWYRLRRVKQGVRDGESSPSYDTAIEQLETMESSYGLVALYVGDGAVPVLFREQMPFGQQERDAIVAAQRSVSTTRTFQGLLPVGSYAIDAVKFEVQPGTEWMVVTAGQR